MQLGFFQEMSESATDCAYDCVKCSVQDRSISARNRGDTPFTMIFLT